MTVTLDNRPRRRVLQLAASFLAVTLQTQIGHIAMAADDDFLKFSSHDLSVQVFSASDLRLVYANSPHALAIGEMAREKTETDATRMPGFTSGEYPTFAGPVEMEWRSKDGTQLKHTLDLDSIFKDRKILHKEDPARIYKPMPISGVPPIIIIEANDRTVNVYMFTTIQIIPEDPNTTRREVHNNCVLAYSKTL
ncbi:hypothetical protein [Undibacterium umbellatum]|uniref:Uncharacterized protein n=1 Tax=Undibacterium umbellatum TaxID=2762300 RepID=A0ABR6Z8M2_9BURK|nr:hypothetical protein [Undibacterium umbellatum]MBC3908121.1 hypothetical protein [Undibacterium umbellatum]